MATHHWLNPAASERAWEPTVGAGQADIPRQTAGEGRRAGLEGQQVKSLSPRGTCQTVGKTNDTKVTAIKLVECNDGKAKGVMAISGRLP